LLARFSTGFGPDITCPKAFSIHLDDYNLEENQFEQFSTFANTTLVDGPSTISFCKAESSGLTTIHFVDLDGSFSPPGVVFPRGASTFMSNGSEILRFADPSKCTLMEVGCYTYCRDTCFRSVRYETPGTSMDGYRLKACKTSDSSNCSIFNGSRRGPNDPRSFLAHLPVGNTYNLVFLDALGHEVLPTAEFTETFVPNLCPIGSGPFQATLVPNLPS